MTKKIDKAISNDEAMEKLESSDAAGGNVKWWGHFRKFGSPSKY